MADNSLAPQQNRPANQAGSGYTNLSQYLNANQNNQLGSTVAGGVQQAGQAATGAVNQAGQQFQSGVNTEQQRLGQAGTQATNTIGNVMGGASVSSSDQSNINSALSGKGKGPSGLSNTDQLTQQSQQASQLGQATGSQAGRYGLLQRYVGRGQNYNLGQQGMDEMLLGQTGGQQLAQARASTVALPGQTQLAINAANQQGQQLSNQAVQLQQNTENQLGNAVNTYNQQMEGKLKGLETQASGLIGQLGGSNMQNQAVNLDANTLNQLSNSTNGLLKAGTNLYNTDLTPFLSVNKLYDNAQGAQTQSDFARLQNLGQLAGNSLAGKPASNTLQQYLASNNQVGQLQNNLFSVSNNAALASALGGAKGGYDSTVQAPLYYNGLQSDDMNKLKATMGNDSFNQASQQATNIEQQFLAANPNLTLADMKTSAGDPYQNMWDSSSWQTDPYQAAIRDQVSTHINDSVVHNAANKFDINRILGVTPTTPAS